MIPLTIEAVAVPGLYVDRTPSPAAIPMGVVRPYRRAAAIGIQLFFWSILRTARREPIPRPSKVSADTVSYVGAGSAVMATDGER